MNFTATCERAEAILRGTYLQHTNPLYTFASEDSDHPTISTTSDSSWSCGDLDSATDPGNENNTVNQLSQEPLHLQRDKVPELVQLLIDSFRYVT